jgi:hypothetical protein
VPLREFFDYLSSKDRLRYRILTERGQVFDFVVQYETVILGEFRPVVRYDASHGRGHRDLLDAEGGTVRKDWLPEDLSLKECLNYAALDLRVNWREYRQQFMEQF